MLLHQIGFRTEHVKYNRKKKKKKKQKKMKEKENFRKKEKITHGIIFFTQENISSISICYNRYYNSKCIKLLDGYIDVLIFLITNAK